MCSHFSFSCIHNHILTPFFLMFISSLISPMVATFDKILKTTRRFLTTWVMYRTSFNLIVYPPCSLIFTVPLSSHFIFWPFTTITSIFHYSMLVKLFFVYVMWNYAPLHPNDSSRYSLLLLSETSPQNVEPTNRLSMSFSFS